MIIRASDKDPADGPDRTRRHWLLTVCAAAVAVAAGFTLGEWARAAGLSWATVYAVALSVPLAALCVLLAVSLRAERACRRTAERLRTMRAVVEQSPSAVIVTDREGVIEYVNPAFTENTGYAPEEALGRTPAILRSEGTPAEVYRQMWQTILAGRVWRGVLQNRRKDGVLYWDALSIAPLRGPAGRVDHFVAVQTNITAQIETEAQLSEARRLYQAVVGAAAEGIVTFDAARRVTSMNPAALRMFGRRSEEVEKLRVEDLFDADSLRAAGWDRWLGEEAAAVFGAEVVALRPDGSRFPAEVSLSRFHMGGAQSYVGVVRDVSERRRMEAELREERNFVSAVLMTSGALIVVLDRQGRIQRFNRACEQATGFDAADVAGRVFWDLFLEDHEREVVRAAVTEATTRNFPCEFETWCRTRTGARRLVAWHGTAMADGRGEVDYVVLTGTDVTEKRRAEEQARMQAALLSHMDRLSLMGEMAATLAHELNQPLTAIYAYATACLRMIGEGRGQDPKVREALEDTARLAQQAGDIIRHIRGFLRRRGPERGEVSQARPSNSRWRSCVLWRGATGSPSKWRCPASRRGCGPTRSNSSRCWSISCATRWRR
jgi:PAS domain S-box-containing protein